MRKLFSFKNLPQLLLDQPDHPLRLPVEVLAPCGHQCPFDAVLSGPLYDFLEVPCGDLLGCHHQLLSPVRLEPRGCPLTLMNRLSASRKLSVECVSMNSTCSVDVVVHTNTTPQPLPTCLFFTCCWYSMGPNRSTANDWNMAPTWALWSGRGSIFCSMHFFSFSLHSVHLAFMESANA